MVDMYWEPSEPMRKLCVYLNKRFDECCWNGGTWQVKPYQVTVQPVIERTTPTLILTVTVDSDFLALAQRDLREFTTYWNVVGGWVVLDEEYQFSDGQCIAVTVTVVSKEAQFRSFQTRVITEFEDLGKSMSPALAEAVRSFASKVQVGIDRGSPGGDFSAVSVAANGKVSPIVSDQAFLSGKTFTHRLLKYQVTVLFNTVVDQTGNFVTRKRHMVYVNWTGIVYIREENAFYREFEEIA